MTTIPHADWLNGFPHAELVRRIHTELSPAQTVSLEGTVRIIGTFAPALDERLRAPIKCPSRYLYRMPDLCIDWDLNITGRGSDDPSVTLEHAVILAQQGDNTFGHWIIDIIPRLIATLPYIDRRECVHLVLREQKDVRFCAEKFERIVKALVPAHWRIHWIQKGDVVVCRTAWVPTLVRCREAFPVECRRHFEIFSNAIKMERAETEARGVFASRAAWHQDLRTLLNRGEIEAVFAEGGFKIIRPEHLALEEFIGYCDTAETVAGERGSALHLAAFAKNVTAFVCILSDMPSYTQMELTQAGLCQLLGKECTLLVGRSALHRPGAEQFTIDPSLARDVVRMLEKRRPPLAAEGARSFQLPHLASSQTAARARHFPAIHSIERDAV